MGQKLKALPALIACFAVFAIGTMLLAQSVAAQDASVTVDALAEQLQSGEVPVRRDAAYALAAKGKDLLAPYENTP